MGTFCGRGNTTGTGPAWPPEAGYILCGLTVVVDSVVVSVGSVVVSLFGP